MTAIDLRVPSPCIALDEPAYERHGVRVYLKRDDLIHPDIPGNKWRKLKHNVVPALEYGAVVTFGGAYSNHLLATAAAGHHFGFRTIGIVRGEEHRPLNDMLQRTVEYGMSLHYVDRSTYRNKTDPEFVTQLYSEFGDVYLIPEGGSNELAIRGCIEMVSEIAIPFDVICCPVGTGGTVAGFAAGLPSPHQRAIGFAALKGHTYLVDEVSRLQVAAGFHSQNWTIESRYHCGGFAKRNAALDSFISNFHHKHGVDLDWVYTAKMMYGIDDSVRAGEFPPGTTIVAVITG